MLRQALSLALIAALTLTATAVGHAEDAPGKIGIQQRRSEGEQILKLLRDQARVAFAKTGAAPRTLTGEVANSGCGAMPEELVGKHYTAQDKIYEAGKDKYALIAEPISAGDGICLLKFNMANSDATTTWHDTMEALKKDNADITFEAAKPKTEATGTAEVQQDPYALYKKKGRMWVLKHSIKIQGMDDMVTHMKTEVVTVEADFCEIKMWMLDKDQKPMAGMPEPTATRIEFKVVDAPADPNAPKIELKEETIEVKAGKFECYVTESAGTKVWSSKKYPGLTVKMEAESMTSELIEFKDE